MNPFRMDDSLREGRVPIYPSTICRSYPSVIRFTVTRVNFTGHGGAGREAVRLALEAENIEARPVWKPMHMQPVFQVERLKAEGSPEEWLEDSTGQGQITRINGRKEAPQYDLPDLRGKQEAQR